MNSTSDLIQAHVRELTHRQLVRDEELIRRMLRHWRRDLWGDPAQARDQKGRLLGLTSQDTPLGAVAHIRVPVEQALDEDTPSAP